MSFYVKIEGLTAIAALDLVAKSGYAQAYVYEADVAVTDGNVNIEFVVIKNNPKISALEVFDPNISAAIRINIGAGSKAYTDSAGQIWSPDTLSIGKTQIVDCSGSDPILGTNNDGIYCTSKWFAAGNSNNGPFRIDTPVPKQGSYTIRMHFAELVSLLLLDPNHLL